MAEKSELEKNNMNEGDFFKVCCHLTLCDKAIFFSRVVVHLFFFSLLKTNILIGG